MFKLRGRNPAPKVPMVGPLYAFDAALAQIWALREGHSAAVRQARERQS